MYIDIDRAEAHGLEIRIEHSKSGGDRLILQPRDGFRLTTLADVYSELKGHGVKPAAATAMTDEMARIAHQGCIWAMLSDLDESEA